MTSIDLFDRMFGCSRNRIPSQSQVNIGAGVRLNSQDDVSHKQEDDPLSLPDLNLLLTTSIVWDESSASNADVVVIPSQCISSMLSVSEVWKNKLIIKFYLNLMNTMPPLYSQS